MIEQKLQHKSVYCLNLSTEVKKYLVLKKDGIVTMTDMPILHYHGDRQRREPDSQLCISMSILLQETQFQD